MHKLSNATNADHNFFLFCAEEEKKIATQKLLCLDLIANKNDARSYNRARNRIDLIKSSLLTIMEILFPINALDSVKKSYISARVS